MVNWPYPARYLTYVTKPMPRIRSPRTSARLRLRLHVLAALIVMVAFLFSSFRPLFGPILSLSDVIDAIPFLYVPSGTVFDVDVFTLVTCAIFLIELLTGRITDFLVRAWQAIERRQRLEDTMERYSSAISRLDAEVKELEQSAVLLKHVSALAAKRGR